MEEPKYEAKVSEKMEETEDDDEVIDILCNLECETRKVQSLLSDNLEYNVVPPALSPKKLFLLDDKAEHIV